MTSPRFKDWKAMFVASLQIMSIIGLTSVSAPFALACLRLTSTALAFAQLYTFCPSLASVSVAKSYLFPILHIFDSA